MKIAMMRMCLTAAVAACACASMAEEAGGIKAAPVGGQGSATVAPSEKAPVQRKEWHGVVAAPADGSAADVVAVLTARERPSKPYALKVVDAELADKVRAFAQQGASVVVNGQLADDEASIAVARCRPMPQPVKEKTAAANKD